jgi:2-oxoglutarate ferredoxin oxidoreductase subunit beta
MCPTGWIIPTADGPGYVAGTFEKTFPVKQLKSNL